MRVVWNSFNQWWYGNDRFNDVVNGVLQRCDDAFVFGGYVRGQIDRDKRISDVDIAVQRDDFVKAEAYLQSVGCKHVPQDRPGWLWRAIPDIETTFVRIGQYERYMCPRAVQVDLIDHAAFSETIDSMPSDVHFLVAKAGKLVSYDEERFSTNDLIESTKAKVYRALRADGIGCKKLEAEGWTRKS